MATVRQYWTTFKNMQFNVADRFGVNLRQAPVATRVIANTDAVLVAVLAKALTDKGVLTDADLTEAWRSARDDNVWDPEI